MQEISRDLLNQAKDGDLRAFHEVYKSLSGFVFSLAMRTARNTADAEEITQDTFIKIHKNLTHYEGRSSFKTWVYRIAVNTALDYCRKRSSIVKKHESAKNDRPTLTSENEATKNLSQEDAEKKLDQLMSCLNEDQRVCIVLREIEGLDYKEIADLLNVKLNTVRTRLRRARQALVDFAQKGEKNELSSI